MTLFADDAQLVGHGATVLACAGAALTQLFGWLNRREELKFNADAVQMKADIKALKDELEECTADRADLRNMVEEYRAGHGPKAPPPAVK